MPTNRDVERLYRPVRDDELMVLTAIVALAQQLPRDLATYAPVLGDIRKNFGVGAARRRGVRGTDRHRRDPSLAQTRRSVRARDRFGS